MTHKDRAYIERLDKLCAELVAIADHYYGKEVVGSQYAKRFSAGKGNSKNRKGLAIQFGILAHLLSAMGEISPVGLDQLAAGVGAMMKEGKLCQPMKLTVPRSPSEFFRRDLLRGLFNAIAVRDEATGSMQSFGLGSLWFKADDDAPRLDMELPE